MILRVLVLGGKGFVGSAIVSEAERRGHAVSTVDLDNYGDVVGTESDVLINANGNSKKFLATEDPVKDFDLSVASVAKSLNDFTTQRYVYLSSIDVYPDKSDPARNAEPTEIDFAQVSPYGFHKHLAEELVRRYAPDWLILRMAGFVGTGLWKNSIHDMLKGRQIRVSPASQYQYLNITDLSRIVFNLLESNARQEIFNVAGDGVVSLQEVAELIPDHSFQPDATTRTVDRCEVNIDKVKGLCHIPRTHDTVKAFVKDALSGKVDLT